MTDTEEPNDAEAFASEIPLTDVFGTHPKTMIIATFLGETTDPITSFSVNEITRISGVDHETVEEHLTEIRAYGIIVETDEPEGERAYKLNEESDAVEDLRRLSDDLFEEVPESNTNG